MIVFRVVGSLYGLFQIDLIQEQHWVGGGPNILGFVKQQLLEMRCQSGPGLGLRLGQQPRVPQQSIALTIPTIFFVLHTKKGKEMAPRE